MSRRNNWSVYVNFLPLCSIRRASGSALGAGTWRELSRISGCHSQRQVGTCLSEANRYWSWFICRCCHSWSGVQGTGMWACAEVGKAFGWQTAVHTDSWGHQMHWERKKDQSLSSGANWRLQTERHALYSLLRWDSLRLIVKNDCNDILPENVLKAPWNDLMHFNYPWFVCVLGSQLQVLLLGGGINPQHFVQFLNVSVLLLRATKETLIHGTWLIPSCFLSF